MCLLVCVFNKIFSHFIPPFTCESNTTITDKMEVTNLTVYCGKDLEVSETKGLSESDIFPN